MSMDIVWQLLPAFIGGVTVAAVAMGGLWLYYRRNHATQSARRR
jgi:hypothetical protein